MPFEIMQAERSGIIPLIAFYGKSGSGKTYSALLVARGLCGPKGRIVLIDSESGRGRIFADVIPGGYSIMPLDAPFSPERYMEAFNVAEAGADVVVIDSFSHEHDGEGGVLDMQEAELTRMAGDNWQKREGCKMASWIKPKGAHKKLVGRILRAKVPLIVCLRGEEKTKMIKGEGGEKSKVVTDDFCTPIADKRFIFELLLNFETLEQNGVGGYVICRKVTHPDLYDAIPAEGKQITIETGVAIAAWAASKGKPAAEPKPATPPDPLRDAKGKLWRLAKPKFKEVAVLVKWLIEKGHMPADGTLETLDIAGLEKLMPIIEEAEFQF